MKKRKHTSINDKKKSTDKKETYDGLKLLYEQEYTLLKEELKTEMGEFGWGTLQLTSFHKGYHVFTYTEHKNRVLIRLYHQNARVGMNYYLRLEDLSIERERSNLIVNKIRSLGVLKKKEIPKKEFIPSYITR